MYIAEYDLFVVDQSHIHHTHISHTSALFGGFMCIKPVCYGKMVPQPTPTVTEDTVQYDTTETQNYTECRERAISVINSADVLVLTDGDADGIASAALVNDVFTNLSVQMIPVGPHGSAYKYTNTAIEDIVEHGRDGMSVFILDTCLDDSDKFGFYRTPLQNLGEKCSVYFFDHHEWSNGEPKRVIEQVSEHAEFESLDHSWVYDGSVISSRATVKMLYDYFTRNGVSFSTMVRDRVFAVSIADTWEKESGSFIHNSSKMLSDSVQEITFHTPLSGRKSYSWWGYREWVNEFLTHEDALNSTDSHISTFASRYQNRIQKELEFIKTHNEYLCEETICGIKTGLVYGDISPNEVSEQLQSEGFDLVVTLRPNGGCSFRSSDSEPICSDIAAKFDGGGHKHSAGGHLFTIDSFNQDEYIESKGNSVQSVVIERIQNAV